MREECLNHKFVYDAPIQSERLVLDVADKHHECTLTSSRRPYGVGLLVAGFDRTGPRLFQTDPTGNYSEFHSMAMGARSQSAKTYLERNFLSFKGCTRNELIRHAVNALHGCLEAEKELDISNTSIAIVGKDEKFHILDGEEVAPFLVGLGAAPAPQPGSAGVAGEEEAKMADEEGNVPPVAGGAAPGMDVT